MLGSQEWFTVQTTSGATHDAEQAPVRGLTVKEIGIQLEIVLLSETPLHSGV